MRHDSAGSTGSTLFALLARPGDALAWNAFVGRYGPRIRGWCQQRGLQDADAQDVAQEVLTLLLRKLPTFAYDPGKGTFRGWLRTLTLHALHDYLEAQKRPGGGSGNPAAWEALASVEAREDLVHSLRETFDFELLAEAQARVQLRVSPRDWKLFQELAVARRPGREVAQEHQMSVAAVLMVKKRVQDKLREEIRRLEGDGPGSE